MTTNDTDTDIDPGDVERTDAGIPTDPLGEADVRIDVDADTYERLKAEYRRAHRRGYPDDFDTFVFNNCSTDWYVTVDGDPVENVADEE